MSELEKKLAEMVISAAIDYHFWFDRFITLTADDMKCKPGTESKRRIQKELEEASAQVKVQRRMLFEAVQKLMIERSAQVMLGQST